MSADACEFHRARDATVLAQEVERFVAGRLREAVGERGQALLVVSGGSTPIPFLEALSQAPLEWPAITVTLADERWVPPDHPDSNEGLVRRHLLKGPAAAARWVPLFHDEAHAAQGQLRTEAALAGLSWPADVVVLGVGADGHTASLFPNDPHWPSASGRCIPLGRPMPPNAPHERLSLTPQALLDTRCLVVHATGPAKWSVLQAARQGGPVSALPIRLALAQDKVPCHVFYAD